jgi:hypothetical protein
MRSSRRKDTDDHHAVRLTLAIASAHRPGRLLAPHRRKANRRHMTGDYHGRTAGRATLLVRAVDGTLGTHRIYPLARLIAVAVCAFTAAGC